jgi:hypothetical protein
MQGSQTSRILLFGNSRAGLKLPAGNPVESFVKNAALARYTGSSELKLDLSCGITLFLHSGKEANNKEKNIESVINILKIFIHTP